MLWKKVDISQNYNTIFKNVEFLLLYIYFISKG